jgi:hypothetical protein
MTNASGSWKPPIVLLVLDVIGVALLGLGIAERFAGTTIVPDWLRFTGYDLVMIIVGALLMLPLGVNVVTHATRRRR